MTGSETSIEAAVKEWTNRHRKQQTIIGGGRDARHGIVSGWNWCGGSRLRISLAGLWREQGLITSETDGSGTISVANDA